jgi:hypothetical protein
MLHEAASAMVSNRRFLAMANTGITFRSDGNERKVAVFKGNDLVVVPVDILKTDLRKAILDEAGKELGKVAEMFGDRVLAELVVPEGHVVRESDPKRVFSAYASGFSIFVDRNPQDEHDPDQLQAEIRVFVDKPYAILFASKGKRFFGENSDLFGSNDTDRFRNADDYDALADSCIARLNKAISENFEAAPAMAI